MKRIAIIGSTGSIGTQTLDEITRRPEMFEATVLTAGTRVDRLIEQARRFRPRLAVIADPSLHSRLAEALRPLGIATAAGPAAIAEATERDDVDLVVTATVGYSGLAPTIAAILAGKDIALANKETLVVAGDLVNRLLASSPTRIRPVDSEHSAISQCLRGEDPATVRSLILTASGGPFLRHTREQLVHVTVADALSHPNWEMGAKITIDSATMINKAFEVIEARWLFGIEPSKIRVLVHPQSIVHSMVEYVDGAIKAQLGVPDMHLPIRYALADECRLDTPDEALSPLRMATLTFELPDTERFPALTLAQTALENGGNTACVINAANEIANEAFRRGQIAFNRIYDVITETLARASRVEQPALADYIESNAEAREIATRIVQKQTL